MKLNHLLYMAGLLTTMAACTSDDVTQQQLDGDRVPVSLSYTTQPQVETRGVASATLNDDNIESSQDVIVRISNYNVGSYTDYTYTTGAAGALNLPANPPYYPINGTTHIDVLAYTPAAASIASDGKFTIQPDQSTSENYIASDLLWATPVTNQARTTDDVMLSFSHKMAKIKVVATAGTAVSQINSIQLLNVQPTVDFNRTTGEVSNLSGEVIAVTMAEGMTASTTTAVAVIPEQEYENANLLAIGVTLNDGTTTGTAYYKITDAKTFYAGNVYTLNITVSYPEVNATTEITGWSENGSVTLMQSVQQQTFAVEGYSILTFNVKGVQFNMVGVKGGSYTTLRGVDVTGTLNDYYIGQTEVTNALWKAVMGSIPSASNRVEDDLPVNNVTYNAVCQTNGFLDKLNEALAGQLPEGTRFTLPSEAQWEYAARGGRSSKGYTFAGSNYLEDVAWWGFSNEGFTSNYTNPSSSMIYGNSEGRVHATGLKRPNELGLYDMSGNVWELCLDYYNSSVQTEQGVDYVNTTISTKYVRRGGGYSSTNLGCSLSSETGQIHYTPLNGTYDGQGLRLALISTNANRSLSTATSSDVGKVICSNGHIHTNASSVDCGGVAVAMIAYYGDDPIDTNGKTYRGLAIALNDLNNGGDVTWCSQTEELCVSDAFTSVDQNKDLNGIWNTYMYIRGKTGHVHQVGDAIVNYRNSIPAPMLYGSSDWFLPSSGQWNLIAKGMVGAAGGTPVNLGSGNNGMQASVFAPLIESAGGTPLQNKIYWMSTEKTAANACDYRAGDGGIGNVAKTVGARKARAVFAF